MKTVTPTGCHDCLMSTYGVSNNREYLICKIIGRVTILCYLNSNESVEDFPIPDNCPLKRDEILLTLNTQTDATF